MTFFLYTRYVLLAAPALVLEGTGVFASFRRAGRLSRGQFWRILGHLPARQPRASVVGQVIAVPVRDPGRGRASSCCPRAGRSPGCC